MEFADRAITACVKAMKAGTVSERHVHDVLCCEDIDVFVIEPYLCSKDGIVRMMAAKIIGGKGRVDALLTAARKEEDRAVLLEMLKCLGSRREALHSINELLSSDNPIIKDSVIDMLRKAGDKDSLFPFIFDKDDEVVQRIKRYLDE